MLKDEVCGTYWYCVNSNGDKCLVDGDRPISTRNGGWKSQNSSMIWLVVSRDDYSCRNGKTIRSSDFKDVKFPDRTYDDGPLEIEIVKSGNVYWYDN